MRSAGDDVSSAMNGLYCELEGLYHQSDDLFLNEALWSLVEDYVGRIANRLSQQDYVDDLLSDALFQTFISISKFRPIKGKSSFSRWICGIVRLRARYLARQRRNDKLIPVSQLEALNWEDCYPDDVFGADDRDPVRLEERLDRLDRVDRVLDQVRDLLEGTDLVMFDLLRFGNSDYMTGKLMGLGQYPVRKRILAWGRMAHDAHIKP